MLDERITKRLTDKGFSRLDYGTFCYKLYDSTFIVTITDDTWSAKILTKELKVFDFAVFSGYNAEYYFFKYISDVLELHS